MTELAESYDPTTLEAKWREEWADSELYRYDDDETTDTDTQYVIDTPPPYPTGDFHIGNALGWCYMDFAARYHRLQGENVSFPQGWDCHGLPTEVKVEENQGIRRTDVSREEFRELCIEHTEGQIDAMKETMQRLGFSQDWEQEFQTMDPDYWAKTQRSFVEMAEKGYVHRDEHPVNWCPRCETAIADAEVENVDSQGTLATVRFSGIDNDDLEIATTRPELLAACVGMAVDPDDERYADRIGDSFEVPLFGQEVELIADEAVDGEFGTGAVMICTFGDKQDVDWWAEYDLDLRPVVTEDGRLDESVAEFGGLDLDEAKAEITTALQKEGYLEDEEPIEQSVGACWRCDTPIEILSKEQWFVRVDQDEILSKAKEIEWVPEHMYGRLEEWTEGMDWDWVISRQRVFATPIPAWSCDDCGHWHIATLDDLPAKPTEDDPATECPECGASEWTGETDVMDTWMDSSISALHAAGWPEESFEPVQLREQGHDIIRTWAFYTILRTAALEDEKPWEEALINGMVLGTDGNKMSKSKDNSVAPIDVVEEQSADAFRQAIALGGQPGSDIQFQHKEVTSASRFLTKLWNITRFASDHLDAADEAEPSYTDTDRWIHSKCARIADDVAADMDEHRFDRALRTVREFVWHDLADDYLELVKGRLYEGTPEEQAAARQTLSTVLSASIRMLAPFSPFLAEETYRHLPGTSGSVHAAGWPELDAEDESVEARGERIAAVASAVRAWKSEAGMALNADLDRVEIYPDDGIDEFDTGDLRATVNAPIEVAAGEPDIEMVPVETDPDHSTIGPKFRDQAGAVVGALEDADPGDIAAQKREQGEIELDANGEVVVLDGDAVDVRHEQRAAGETVEVLDADGATVLVFP
ncbi:valyl-tRNA ligase [Halococcus morrhuae DSM 1307]|uniref:Valine--tRNA ligase n=1 Tax=Halococcus morrhuae DSM 1307 TaxID=931277 RepID=M0M2Q5_HALMO|nr:valine--tRNA ligase [Halococcus morrhuae]EMA38894.1 valyl-tRNA ligase [Halococcus morrhuae DSM 1307]